LGEIVDFNQDITKVRVADSGSLVVAMEGGVGVWLPNSTKTATCYVPLLLARFVTERDCASRCRRKIRAVSFFVPFVWGKRRMRRQPKNGDGSFWLFFCLGGDFCRPNATKPSKKRRATFFNFVVVRVVGRVVVVRVVRVVFKEWEFLLDSIKKQPK